MKKKAIVGDWPVEGEKTGISGRGFKVVKAMGTQKRRRLSRKKTYGGGGRQKLFTFYRQVGRQRKKEGIIKT